jgi:molybdopterin-guanine dinucleotide biosynthesis protein A
MGTPKAGLRLASGRTIFDHVYGCVRELSLPCVVVGHADGIELHTYPGLLVIPDEITERGPVGALLGLLKSNVAHHYLVLACDQPLLSPKLLSRLLTVIDERPNVFSNQEAATISPLPGLYPAGLLPIVETLLQQPRASLRELLAQADVRPIILDKEDWKLLRSANTAQDLVDIEALFRPAP